MLFRAAYGRRGRRRVRVLHKPYAILALTHPVSRSEEITLQPTTYNYNIPVYSRPAAVPAQVRQTLSGTICVCTLVRSFVQPLSVSIYLARSRAYSLARSLARLFVCQESAGSLITSRRCAHTYKYKQATCHLCLVRFKPFETRTTTTMTPCHAFKRYIDFASHRVEIHKGSPVSWQRHCVSTGERASETEQTNTQLDSASFDVLGNGRPQHWSFGMVSTSVKPLQRIDR